MNYIERLECPSCKRPVLLSYVPTENQTMHDHQWTCPHCRAKHQSTREGTIVAAVRG